MILSTAVHGEGNWLCMLREAVARTYPADGDEAAALLILLRSFRGDEHVPDEMKDHLTEREERIVRGRALSLRYNCVGCHVIEESFATADGRLLISASDDQTLKLWDLEKGNVVETFYGANPFLCVSVAGNRVGAGDNLGNVWMLALSAPLVYHH